MFGEPYSEEQIAFLRKKFRKLTISKLTEAFNAKFGSNRTSGSISGVLYRNRILSGRNGQFKKNTVPWNKGLKRPGTGGRSKFKKGNVPATAKPLYFERVCKKDGYIMIKVPKPCPRRGSRTSFVLKHVWLWEQAHGSVPEGMCVCFRDGDRRNLDLENLMLVSRLELARMNINGYLAADEELRPTIAALSKLEALTIRSKNRRMNADGERRKEEEGEGQNNQDQHWQACEGQGKNSKKDAGQLQEQPA